MFPFLCEKVRFSCVVVATLFLALPRGAQATEITNIGAIIDVESRIGKEEKIAMKMAVCKFNNDATERNLSLYFKDSQGGSIKVAAHAAEKLLKERKVKLIVGMERWEDAALVADVGRHAQVPVVSFSAPSISTPFTHSRWPFLIRMTHNDSEQVKCIAAIIRSHRWRRVVTVSEDYGIDGDSAKLTLLAQALQQVDSEIEYRLVLPPFSFPSDPNEAIKKELQQLKEKKIQSRVFIVLQTSLPVMTELFRESQHMGFLGPDTVWILSDAVSRYLDSVDTSVLSSMEGALGIKSYYNESSLPYKKFKYEFQQNFRAEYPDEDNLEPGFHALRAYDSMTTIIKAIERMPTNNSSPKILLNNILSSNFSGLSGWIQFKTGELVVGPEMRVLNVVGRKYKDLDFWIPEFGFSRTLAVARDGKEHSELQGPVIWPGEMRQDPKGWAMPSQAEPLIIGVPGRTSFEKFVKVVNVSEGKYDGFCIELFYKVKDVLGYNLPFKFVPHNGTYDDLVHQVYIKNYSAVIGDVTILADRSEIVEFTQPYAESGLSMIVPDKSKESTWMFVKPFTGEMWLVTSGIFLYTTLIVWFLEHQDNPEFKGRPLIHQILTALWFTFSSLFFSHREKVYSNLTRVVVVVWLFVVFILNSSYTASLTSMLTVQRMQPNITNINWLLENNLKVGCDGDSFVRDYLMNVLGFKAENIMNVSNEYLYEGKFKKKDIFAAFLELPYQKVFISNYCKTFTATTPTYRFGGLGFVFQKGSPMATDFSKAILKLSENGELKKLEDRWFATSPECSNTKTKEQLESLSLHSFWGLYVISGGTSTICFLLFMFRLVKKYRNDQQVEDQGSALPTDDNVWKKTARLACYIYYRKRAVLVPTLAQSPGHNHQRSSPICYSTPSV
ncbi:hypothetical protein K2173_001548 [Erythroxylum novogranatense]|uniref:Glutamate receptor n=1 Tax=Erythroxylum novogranatense TaxID=1862640 RepID=A0AAV8T433_9ROSI|nr:hypothetical protein K2173_001548 [Erythroxylum novogranatense]